MDEMKSHLQDVDVMLKNLENKPYERMVKMEQEKLNIINDVGLNTVLALQT
jgi:hypothetical protein